MVNVESHSYGVPVLSCKLGDCLTDQRLPLAIEINVISCMVW